MAERKRVFRTTPRTPEEVAEDQAIREHFADRPSIDDLIARGDLDPDRITTMDGHFALFRAFVALRRERERKGLSLTEVARRSGLDPSSLDRLESGKDQNPTYETITRYAAALGLDVHLEFRDREAPPAEEQAGISASTVPLLDTPERA
jgi:DNA-binding phage protein